MKRTLALGAAWTASAGVAVGLGFLAVSLVDASASPGTQPAAAAGPTSAAVASATSSPTSSTSATAGGTSAPTLDGGPGAPAPGASVEQVTLGGTVYATCADGLPVLASAPTPGWWVDDPSKANEVEFEDGTTKIEVAVSCSGGSPSFFVEGPRDDDGGREDDSSGTASPTSAASPATDDSDGRRGGGHGSDDGPGDDSSGRDGGGHGSDD
jgi:hypothetical protein